MMALSIRQPWAWLILNAGKDIENRDWATNVRGHILIHASKGMTRDEYEGAQDTLWDIHEDRIRFPAFAELERGGFVGTVEIADCVAESSSPWFFGNYGFVLRDPKPMPFIPYKGRLGFFDVPICLNCGGVAGEHSLMCFRDTEPPKFGAMHS